MIVVERHQGHQGERREGLLQQDPTNTTATTSTGAISTAAGLTTTRTTTTVVMAPQHEQQQKFHEDAVQKHAQHGHQPIQIGNYAVQQPRKSFQGASDGHLEELISACQQPRLQENIHDIEEVGGVQMNKMKQERTLVPFFDAGSSEGSENAALDWPVSNGSQAKGKHGGAKHNKKQLLSNAEASNHNSQQVKYQQGRAGGKKGGEKGGKIGGSVKSPKHGGNQHFTQNKPGHVHSFQRGNNGSKFAGPAFTVSPVPEKLPMPSGKLL
jgi:hypothetical protein